MAEFDLLENEEVIKECLGDYWKKIVFYYSQKRGTYCFTNQRIIFSGSTDLDLYYKDIEEIKTCMVGPLIGFIPTGVKVKMKDGKTHKLSLLGRKKYMEIIESYIK